MAADFFECEVMLIVEQEDGSAGGRDVVEEGSRRPRSRWLATETGPRAAMSGVVRRRGVASVQLRSRRLERGMEILPRLLVTVER